MKVQAIKYLLELSPEESIIDDFLDAKTIFALLTITNLKSEDELLNKHEGDFYIDVIKKCIQTLSTEEFIDLIHCK